MGRSGRWHYGSKFVYEVWQRLEKPALMEMSTFHHHLWCVRSRYCAWDHPTRSHKRFIDMHTADNDNSRRMFLPGELGWWALKNWTGPQGEPTFADDIEYLMTKALATDTGFALMGIDPKHRQERTGSATSGRHHQTIRRSASCGTGRPRTEIRAQPAPAQEFTLVGDLSAGWHFVPVDYAKHRVEESDGPTATWTTDNKFAAQPLRLRIEALMAAGTLRRTDNLTLADFQSAEEFSQRATQQDVTAELTSSKDQVQAGSVSGDYSSVNQSPDSSRRVDQNGETASHPQQPQCSPGPRSLDPRRRAR